MLALLTKLSALLRGWNAGSLDGGRVAAFVVPIEARIYLVGLEVFHRMEEELFGKGTGGVNAEFGIELEKAVTLLGKLDFLFVDVIEPTERIGRIVFGVTPKRTIRVFRKASLVFRKKRKGNDHHAREKSKNNRKNDFKIGMQWEKCGTDTLKYPVRGVENTPRRLPSQCHESILEAENRMSTEVYSSTY